MVLLTVSLAPTNETGKETTLRRVLRVGGGRGPVGNSSGYGKQVTYEKRTDEYCICVYRCSPPSE